MQERKNRKLDFFKSSVIDIILVTSGRRYIASSSYLYYGDIDENKVLKFDNKTQADTFIIINELDSRCKSIKFISKSWIIALSSR